MGLSWFEWLCEMWFNLIESTFRRSPKSFLTYKSETNLPTNSGIFRVRCYEVNGTHNEAIAIVSGSVEGGASIPIRVHDQCFTSEVLGSRKCDCKEQLELSMQHIKTTGGVVIYLQQEGRGIGLANKIAAYSLQERGYDTVEANRMLGLPDDTREYHAVPEILADLGIKSVHLMTNNPRKIEHLRKLGIAISDRIAVHIPPNTDNVNYLKTKVEKMNHLISTAEW